MSGLLKTLYTNNIAWKLFTKVKHKDTFFLQILLHVLYTILHYYLKLFSIPVTAAHSTIRCRRDVVNDICVDVCFETSTWEECAVTQICFKLFVTVIYVLWCGLSITNRMHIIIAFAFKRSLCHPTISAIIHRILYGQSVIINDGSCYVRQGYLTMLQSMIFLILLIHLGRTS